MAHLRHSRANPLCSPLMQFPFFLALIEPFPTTLGAFEVPQAEGSVI